MTARTTKAVPVMLEAEGKDMQSTLKEARGHKGPSELTVSELCVWATARAWQGNKAERTADRRNKSKGREK